MDLLFGFVGAGTVLVMVLVGVEKGEGNRHVAQHAAQAVEGDSQGVGQGARFGCAATLAVKSVTALWVSR